METLSVMCSFKRVNILLLIILEILVIRYTFFNPASYLKICLIRSCFLTEKIIHEVNDKKSKRIEKKNYASKHRKTCLKRDAADICDRMIMVFLNVCKNLATRIGWCKNSRKVLRLKNKAITCWEVKKKNGFFRAFCVVSLLLEQIAQKLLRLRRRCSLIEHHNFIIVFRFVFSFGVPFASVLHNWYNCKRSQTDGSITIDRYNFWLSKKNLHFKARVLFVSFSISSHLCVFSRPLERVSISLFVFARKLRWF